MAHKNEAGQVATEQEFLDLQQTLPGFGLQKGKKRERQQVIRDAVPSILDFPARFKANVKPRREILRLVEPVDPFLLSSTSSAESSVSIPI